jgi:hypothetical protein
MISPPLPSIPAFPRVGRRLVRGTREGGSKEVRRSKPLPNCGNFCGALPAWHTTHPTTHVSITTRRVVQWCPDAEPP